MATFMFKTPRFPTHVQYINIYSASAHLLPISLKMAYSYA